MNAKPNTTSNGHPTSNPDFNVAASIAHLLDAHRPSDAHNSHPSHPTHSSHQSHPPVPTRNPSKSPDVPPVPPNLLKISSRADDRIAQLPPEDQEQILHWFASGLTFRKIIELAAQPRPEGLATKLSLGVLHRFYHKHELAEKIAMAAELVADLCPESAADAERAFEILAQTHAINTMAGPDLDHTAFQHITRYLLRQEDQRIRQRALDLKEKRLAFDMEHKHYDIFKRTIEQLPEINEIVRAQSLTPAEKFREFRIKMHGQEAVEMVDRANEKWAREHPDHKHTMPDYDEKDVIPPMTAEEKQKADTEAINIMMGWKNPHDGALLD
jgi:hypothetical protein